MSDASLSSILLLGDPRLRTIAQPVDDVRDPVVRAEVRSLGATLAAFRAERGFGRAISAPQLGIERRMIVMDLGDGNGPTLIANPEITEVSDETFTMWDDCMSFPSLLVRVRRHESISIRFQDDTGAVRTWERIARAEAELLQHEIDHLDGVLALDRAYGESPFVTRSVFEASPARYVAEVDYAIGVPAGRPRLASQVD
jgi:peptide deformylase